jgi:hypothetical protein
VEVLVTANGATRAFHALFGASSEKKLHILGEKEKVVCGSRASQAILCGDFCLSLWEMLGVLLPCKVSGRVLICKVAT